MKSFIVLLIFLNLTIIIISQTNKIIGKWSSFAWSKKEVEIAEPDGSIEFKKDNTVIIYQGKDKLPIGTYKLNINKNPFWLDITISDPSKNKVTIFGLIEFTDANTTKFELFSPEISEHPTQFSDESEGITENLSVLRRLSTTGEIISNGPKVDPIKIQLLKNWNVYPWARRFDDTYKVSTNWEFKENSEFIQQGPALWQGSYSGTYQLNTSVQPYWIDLKLPGLKIFGLFEVYGPEIKIEFFPNYFLNEHPTQFSDLLYGPDVLGSDKNIFYLK